MLDPNIALILSTLLGGTLTIIGGFAANYYVQKTASNSEKRKETRLSLEQLNEILLNSITIANLINRKMYYEENLEEHPLELIHLSNKILSTTILYFQELQGNSYKFTDKITDLYYLCNYYKTGYELDKLRKELKEISQSIEDEGGNFIDAIVEFIRVKGYN